MMSACDMETDHCEFCDRPMTEDEYNFCDICGECMDEIGLDDL